jgi:hypothetical protein
LRLNLHMQTRLQCYNSQVSNPSYINQQWAVCRRVPTGPPSFHMLRAGRFTQGISPTFPDAFTLQMVNHNARINVGKSFHYVATPKTDSIHTFLGAFGHLISCLLHFFLRVFVRPKFRTAYCVCALCVEKPVFVGTGGITDAT